MGGSRVAVAGAALLALSLVRCTIALDGYTNGPIDGGLDAPPDGAATPPPSEGGINPLAPPAGAPFCSAHASAAFCADFDDGPANKGWSDDDIRGSGSLDLDSSLSVSAPRSLHATEARVEPTGDAQTYQQLMKSVDQSARKTTLDFDVLLQPITFQSNDGGFTIAEIYFDEDEKSGVLLYINKDGWELLLEPDDSDHPATVPFPFGVWTHVRLEAEPKISGGSAKIFVGIPQVLAVDVKSAPLLVPNANQSQLWIGLGSSDAPRPPIDVHYDNIVYDFPP